MACYKSRTQQNIEIGMWVAESKERRKEGRRKEKEASNGENKTNLSHQQNMIGEMWVDQRKKKLRKGKERKGKKEEERRREKREEASDGENERLRRRRRRKKQQKRRGEKQ